VACLYNNILYQYRIAKHEEQWRMQHHKQGTLLRIISWPHIFQFLCRKKKKMQCYISPVYASVTSEIREIKAPQILIWHHWFHTYSAPKYIGDNGAFHVMNFCQFFHETKKMEHSGKAASLCPSPYVVTADIQYIGSTQNSIFIRILILNLTKMY
jgi:hypothetical protein